MSIRASELGLLVAASLGQQPGVSGGRSTGSSGDVGERDRKIGGLRAEHTEASGQISAVEESKKSHDQKALEALQAAQDAATKAAGHEKRIGELDTQIGELTQTIAGKTQELAGIDMSKPEGPKQAAAIRAEITKLEGQKRQLEAERKTEQDALDAARRLEAEKMAEAADELKASQSDETEKSALEQKVAGLEEKIATLEAEMEKLRAEQEKNGGGLGEPQEPETTPPGQQPPGIDPPPPIGDPTGGDPTGQVSSLASQSEYAFGQAQMYANMAEAFPEMSTQFAQLARAEATRANQLAVEAQNKVDQITDANQKAIAQKEADRAKENARKADVEAKRAEKAAGIESPNPEGDSGITTPPGSPLTRTETGATVGFGGGIESNVATWNQVTAK